MAEQNRIVLDAITQQRHFTAAEWTSTNPKLYEGEIGFESDTKKFKFGIDANWNSTPYADSIPVSTNRAPVANDSGYKLGQLWMDVSAPKLYWLKAIAGSVATWVAVPNDDTITDMLNDFMAKSVFAKNGGAPAGKVDHALKSDALASARSINLSGDASGAASFDGASDTTLSVLLKKLLATPITVQGLPVITVDKTGRITAISQMTPGDARLVLGLGTASTKAAGNNVGAVPIIGANGKLDTSIMPQLTITDVNTSGSEAEMLALTAQQGDICRRTDESMVYILAGTDPAVRSNWVLWLTPECDVVSVNGKTGIVVLTTDNVTEGGSNLYWTASRFNTAFRGMSTTDLKEGVNLYFTEDRVKSFLESHSFILNGNK